ncbi:MAG: Tfp pilus assembly protein PilF, partial [Polyangiales bacterium]
MNRACGWLVAALLVGMPSVLCAQEVESTEAHEVLFQRAVEALRQSQYEVASRSFEESLRLQPQAKTACNLALAYDRWGGHEVEARDAYVRCAELDQDGRFRDHALARAAALRDVISRRPPDVPG